MKKKFSFSLPFPSLFKAAVFFAIIGLAVTLTFVLMDPKVALPPPSFPIPNALMLVNNAIARAHMTTSGLSQSVINACLNMSRQPEWNLHGYNISLLQWNESCVILEEGRLTYHLRLTLLKYPIYCTEMFRLTGIPANWQLEPLSGSVGRLPIKGQCLSFFTNLMAYSISSLNAQLKAIASFEIVQIHPGLVELARK